MWGSMHLLVSSGPAAPLVFAPAAAGLPSMPSLTVEGACSRPPQVPGVCSGHWRSCQEKLHGRVAVAAGLLQRPPGILVGESRAPPPARAKQSRGNSIGGIRFSLLSRWGQSRRGAASDQGGPCPIVCLMPCTHRCDRCDVVFMVLAAGLLERVILRGAWAASSSLWPPPPRAKVARRRCRGSRISGACVARTALGSGPVGSLMLILPPLPGAQKFAAPSCKRRGGDVSLYHLPPQPRDPHRRHASSKHGT